jgi:dTMP kinase
LKFFEAGMDLRLSNDIQESFRIFQGRLLEQYLAMSTEFNFTVIDANEPVETQQMVVRQLVSKRVDLAAYKRRKPAPPPPSVPPGRRPKPTPEEEPVE